MMKINELGVRNSLALSASGIYCPDTNAQTGIGFDRSDFPQNR
jgi:hypothetical protein